MVQTRKLDFVIDCPWDVAVLAYQTKFWDIPNPDIPDVLEVQFTDFHLDTKTGDVTFKRMGRVALNAPGFLLRLAGTSEMTFHSETTINRGKKTLRSVGTNETFRPRMELDEITTFAVHPDDPTKTLLTLEGTLTLNISFFGQGILEKLVISRYEAGCKKGREIEKPKMMEFKKKYAGKTPPLCRSEKLAREALEKSQADEAKKSGGDAAEGEGDGQGEGTADTAGAAAGGDGAAAAAAEGGSGGAGAGSDGAGTAAGAGAAGAT